KMGPWNAAWTRKHLLSHITFDDHLFFIEQKQEYGFDRRWFSRVWFDGEEVVFPVLAQSFLTSSPGSNQTWTSPGDWNNTANTVECVGGGGGAGGAQNGGASGAEVGTGGGGGEYAKITNFSVAAPGTTTATYNVGSGGGGNTLTGNTNANGGNGTTT